MVVKIERRRYLLVQFLHQPPEIKKINRNLREIVLELSGQLGLATSGLHILDIGENTNYIVVRCNHHSRDIVESAIQMLKYEENIPVVKYITGTIKKISKLLNKEVEDTD